MQSRISNFALIVPRSGLNDTLNQIQTGLDACKTANLTPIVCLEANPIYACPLSDLLVFKDREIFDYSEVADELDLPSIESLSSLATPRWKGPRNQIVNQGGVNLIIGRGGGLAGSIRLLSEATLSPGMESKLQEALRDTKTSTLAVHLRCFDVFPSRTELQIASRHAKRKLVTLYTDCDSNEYVDSRQFIFGFPGNGLPAFSTSLGESRAADDIVSLFLMSKHEELRLIKFSVTKTNNRYFGYRYSGFGLLALAMNLRSKVPTGLFQMSFLRPLLLISVFGPLQLPSLLRAIFDKQN